MKKLILLTAFVCAVSYATAQDNMKENKNKRTKVYRYDFSAKSGQDKPDKPDIFLYRFRDMDIENLNKDLEELRSALPAMTAEQIEKWKKDNEKFSKDLAMKMPDQSMVFSYNFPESVEFHFDTKESKETQQDNDELFNKLSDIKDVEVVYVSKSLLKMVAGMNISGMNTGGVDIKNIVGKLESLQVFSSEKSSAIKKLKSESSKLVKKGKYETLMFVKDDDSKTVFYMNKINSQKSEMLMITEEPNEVSIIRFTGSFTVKDIQNLTDKNKNK